MPGKKTSKVVPTVEEVKVYSGPEAFRGAFFQAGSAPTRNAGPTSTPASAPTGPWFTGPSNK